MNSTDGSDRYIGNCRGLLRIGFRTGRCHDHREQRGRCLFRLNQLAVTVLTSPSEDLVRVDAFFLRHTCNAHPRLKRQLHDPTLFRNRSPQSLPANRPRLVFPFHEPIVQPLTFTGPEGKTTRLLSNFNLEQMKRVQKIAPITNLQPPYSMLRPTIEKEVLPFVQANGIGVINYSPMVSGLLTGKMTAERVAAFPADDWRKRAVEFNEPRLSRNLRLVELLREIGSGHGVTPGVVAVAWTLHHPAITAAIVGGRSPQQVEELSAALTFRLNEEEYARINGFLAAHPV